MKIFRSLLETKESLFLIDAEHQDGQLLTVHLRPIVGGVVLESLPLCHCQGVEKLIRALQDKVKELD